MVSDEIIVHDSGDDCGGGAAGLGVRGISLLERVFGRFDAFTGEVEAWPLGSDLFAGD